MSEIKLPNIAQIGALRIPMRGYETAHFDNGVTTPLCYESPCGVMSLMLFVISRACAGVTNPHAGL